MTKNTKGFLAGTVAFFIFSYFRNQINVSNMLFYILACAIFVVVAVGYQYLEYKLQKKENIPLEKAISIFLIITLVLWICIYYITETNFENSLKKEEIVRHFMEFPLWLIVIVSVTAGILLLWRKEAGENYRKIRKWLRVLVTLIFTILTSAQFYAPNIFQDIQGGTYHSHAYTNSIINVCWLIPYTEDMQSLYGHYAIFYMPILKIMHHFFQIDYLTGLFIVSSVVAGISMLIFAWVLNYFAKKELIYYLGLFSIGEYYFMLMQGGVFLQVHPHRMIFPIMIIALALEEKKKEKNYNIVAILLLTLSIVWSTEVGLVLIAAFSMYRCLQRYLKMDKMTIGSIRLFLAEIFLNALLPFLLAYFIVIGYNLFAKGPIIDIEEFLYPLISERGYIGKIELPLPNILQAWTATSILFLIPVGMGIISALQISDKKRTIRDSFLFLIGLTGLGLLLYYINRPVAGSLFIIMYLMLILQIMILQKGQEKYEEWRKDRKKLWEEKDCFIWLCLRIITLVILIVLSVDSLYSIPESFRTAKETIWKREDMMKLAEDIYWDIPPMAVAFGEGVPEVLSIIDRTTHLHTTEWSYKNMPLDTMERIRNKLEGEQWIFCNLYSLWMLQENYPGLTDNYELGKIIEYNGAQFGLFTIKNGE